MIQGRTTKPPSEQVEFKHPELLISELNDYTTERGLTASTESAAAELSDHVSSRSSSFRRKSAIGIIEPGMRSFDRSDQDTIQELDTRRYLY